MFVRNGYLYDDLFKINVMTIITKDEVNNKNNASSSYLLKSCDMWHVK
jgi:hypothetical protein